MQLILVLFFKDWLEKENHFKELSLFFKRKGQFGVRFSSMLIIKMCPNRWHRCVLFSAPSANYPSERVCIIKKTWQGQHDCPACCWLLSLTNGPCIHHVQQIYCYSPQAALHWRKGNNNFNVWLFSGDFWPLYGWENNPSFHRGHTYPINSWQLDS